MAHPNNKMAVSVAASGSVLVWAQNYRESWTAFAPDFKDLEENEEYVEREDEFDDDPDPALEVRLLGLHVRQEVARIKKCNRNIVRHL